MSLYGMFLEKLILPLLDRLNGSNVMETLGSLRTFDGMSQEEVSAYQEAKLRELLRFASERSGYYRGLAIAEQENTVEWLKAFPILDKALLKANTDAMLTTDDVDHLYRHSSSGSSGIQAAVYLNEAEQSRYRAQQIHWWEWAGYRFGTPLLQTGITPKRGLVKKVKDILLRTRYISAFSHKETEIVETLKTVQGKQEYILAGYASSLYVIAQIAEKHGIKIRFKSAISWGDKLFAHYREKIEAVFGCKVYETYGSAETLMVASQHDQPYLYLNTPNLYIEILDDDGCEVEDGEMGHVVVTSLHIKTMPLIRYRLGDLAVKLPRDQYPAAPALPYPLLAKVVGRDTDIVKTSGGTSLVVHAFTGIFEYFPQIRQFQVVQDDLEGIKISYIPETDFTPDLLESIRSQILEQVGEDFGIEFEATKTIPSSPSGKPQIVVSHLQKAEL